MLNWGYKEDLIREQIDRAGNISRNQLLKKRSKTVNDEQPVTLVLPYHPAIQKHL